MGKDVPEWLLIKDISEAVHAEMEQKIWILFRIFEKIALHFTLPCCRL